MGLLVGNRLPVISQTIFIKVAVRQQMWAQPDKSLLLSGTTAVLFPATVLQAITAAQEAQDGAGRGMAIA